MNRKVKHILAWNWLTCWKHVFFHRWKPRKVHICLHLIFYPPDNVLLCKAMLVRYQLFITYMLLLANVMFSSEHSYFTMACRACHA